MSPEITPPTYLHLTPLSLSHLPQPTDASAVSTLITALLSEAIPFLSSVPSYLSTPATRSYSWKSKGATSHASSAAPINLYTRRDSGSDETWACRVSVHQDEARPGTASWDEFWRGIKVDHAENEKAYTPGLVAHKTVRSWDLDSLLSGFTVPDVFAPGQQVWGDFTLRIEEARHNVGRPVIKDRVFMVLQLTASLFSVARGGKALGDCLIVSVPVGREDDKEEEDEMCKDAVEGVYAAVERVRRLPREQEQDGRIEWIMATASDAKGKLPMWVQTRAVPGQIAKDVGLFLGWVAKRRDNAG